MSSPAPSPRLCRSVTSPLVVKLEVVFAFVFGVTGIALTSAKQWIAGFVFLAVSILLGVHADGSLRVKLATGSCDDKALRASLLFTESWTAILILIWLAMCIWLAVRAQQKL